MKWSPDMKNEDNRNVGESDGLQWPWRAWTFCLHGGVPSVTRNGWREFTVDSRFSLSFHVLLSDGIGLEGDSTMDERKGVVPRRDR